MPAPPAVPYTQQTPDQRGRMAARSADMTHAQADAGIGAGGLGLATWAGSISDVLQVVILLLTIVLLAYRIRNARDRAKDED